MNVLQLYVHFFQRIIVRYTRMNAAIIQKKALSD